MIMKTTRFAIWLLAIIQLVACTAKKEVQHMNSTSPISPPPEDSAVIAEYVAKHKSWQPTDYRIETMRKENDYIVYEIRYLKDETGPYDSTKSLQLGGSRSFAIYYDPVGHKVLKEMQFQ